LRRDELATTVIRPFVCLSNSLNVSVGALECHPQNFWDEWSNVFDMLVMILGVATQLLYVSDPLDYEAAEEGAIVIRILRDGFQFLRLGVFLKNHAKSEPYKMVDFSSVDEFGTVPVRFQNDDLLDEACGEMSEESSVASGSSSDF